MALLSKKRISKVNARRLLDDMASMYSHSIEETVLVEAVANSLDAWCTRIEIQTDAGAGTFTVRDDGRGMTEGEFDQYHDLAESTKTRGKGIGFAGLGGKLAHKVAKRVRTDTRSESYSGGTDWYWKADDLEFKSRRCRLEASGTQVEVELDDSMSNLLDPTWIEQNLRLHYAALLDPVISQQFIISGIYPSGVQFTIDGRSLRPAPLLQDADVDKADYLDIPPTRGRAPIGKGFFVVAARPLPEGMQGVALATMGKVIKRDTLGMSPSSADRITGLVDVPDLVGSLTTSKQGFLESGREGTKYRQLRGQVQKVYSEWLAKVGQHIDAAEARRAPKALERELAELAKLVPELDYLFGHRKKASVAVTSKAAEVAADERQGQMFTEGSGGGTGRPGPGDAPLAHDGDEGSALEASENGTTPARMRRRTVRRGPTVRLVDDPARQEMSWLEPDSVVVNTAHPAYLKAGREHQVRYHTRLAALLALCSGASEENRFELLRRAITVWGAK